MQIARATILLVFLVWHVDCVRPAVADSRVILAQQDDFDGTRGFVLDLESKTRRTWASTAKLADLQMVLAVADGHGWRYLSFTPLTGWRYDRQYRAHAVIDGQRAFLSVDGVEVARSDGGFVPDASRLVGNETPNWAASAADYWGLENSLRVACAGKPPFQHDFPSTAAQLSTGPNSPPLHLDSGVWKAGKGPVTIDAVFTLADKRAHLPIVDRYGQYRYGRWSNKITSDGQLRATARTERRRLTSMQGLRDVDRYGGALHAGWKDAGTGYYHVVRHNGYWWLITPAGNPVFYTGICTAPEVKDGGTPVTGRKELFAYIPPKTGPFADAVSKGQFGESNGPDYVSFDTLNLIRKFGPAYQKESNTLLTRRIKAWGFVGVGKYTQGGSSGVPWVGNLWAYGLPVIDDNKPDVFDPAIVAKLRDHLRSQMTPWLHDPNCVGWTLGSELEDRVKYSTIDLIFRSTSGMPAKKALVDYALQKYYHGIVGEMGTACTVESSTPADLYGKALSVPADRKEDLREYFENAYLRTVYDVVKSIDPNHLYLGDMITPNWWVDPSDWDIEAAHCDVIGYDAYGGSFSDPLKDLPARTNKPIFCGEFSYAPSYDGCRGLGFCDISPVETDADAGAAYARWISDASRNPYCVGGDWFEYRDEPITGRGPGSGTDLVIGEFYGFGLVDVADQPKWDLIEPMRRANIRATADRLAASGDGK